ncbi:uncharacterized protein Nmag_0577 [Natrialba magadii ATCC 43099]|uniref:DUF8054 domain-containing protein n=1 Tax=Natrialba magadii (strain ATCC 43099 / DSM 3394 / CCM 3739 / CIP 104546 / IAM 13178 / JCM 8861 / NBRC 102185 / NCIMB 2190 / MS3) TaxID=547559 RepID=D3SYQ3_NATMM|nr:hypothetical protein [Natrialba magadii]ADD04164.1 uncharacterized protein Nmag_0577 [Natrialba magadii ATCC 43099]ELY32950.1 hypothetical protein C500_03299 [Natrialba magadii ATCC 43099]
MAFPGPIDRLHQPEYTGENRCLPCTAGNIVLAVLLSATAAALAWFGAGPVVALGVGIGILSCSVGAIAIRGYLVPGTPELTKQYLPDRLRQRFHDREPGLDDGADLDLAMKGIGTIQTQSDERSDGDESETADETNTN